MKCFKCDKEMENLDGDYAIKGINVDVTFGSFEPTPENIKYANVQLGKYSKGNGEAHVAICYECYIDGLFNIRRSV